jgi:hypothetical protein
MGVNVFNPRLSGRVPASFSRVARVVVLVVLATTSYSNGIKLVEELPVLGEEELEMPQQRLPHYLPGEDNTLLQVSTLPSGSSHSGRTGQAFGSGPHIEQHRGVAPPRESSSGSATAAINSLCIGAKSSPVSGQVTCRDTSAKRQCATAVAAVHNGFDNSCNGNTEHTPFGRPGHRGRRTASRSTAQRQGQVTDCDEPQVPAGSASSLEKVQRTGRPSSGASTRERDQALAGPLEQSQTTFSKENRPT